jgi:hypothetical protein
LATLAKKVTGSPRRERSAMDCAVGRYTPTPVAAVGFDPIERSGFGKASRGASRLSEKVCAVPPLLVTVRRY